MVIAVAAPAATVVEAKLLPICGLAICSVPTAAAEFDPPLVESAPTGMLLAYAPPVGAFTLTVIVHTLLAGIVPPASLRLPLPMARAAPAPSVKVPPQVLVVVVLINVMLPGAPATVLGKVSVNVTAVIAVAVGLVRVILRLDVTFDATVPGVNDLLMAGGFVTVRL